VAVKKLDLTDKEAHHKKIAEEPIAAAELRKALNELKVQGGGLGRNLKPFVDFQNELDVDIARWLKQLDSPQKKNALDGLYQQRRPKQAGLEAEEAKIRDELEKELRLERKEKLELEIAALGAAVKRLEADQKNLQIEKG